MKKQIKTSGVVPISLTAAMMAGVITFPALAADYILPDSQKPETQFVHPHESILAEDVPFGAPNAKPPPYTILRYTERYSYLADPAKRTDPFDAYKYIPLDPENTESYLSFGGEIRERYEQSHNQALA